MIKTILGSEVLEKVLIYFSQREKGYGREIAAFYDINVNQIQKQLKKLEEGAVLVSFLEGRTRVYQFNPSYIFLPELKALVQKAFQFYPSDQVEKLQMNRRRPRQTGKP
ncbi:MAG: ArsR family transcriptional regulator [Chloroflexi bacterium HGW-Chloroflexi-5]|jgi:predicted transcriptional regulator|nr:MAG: ArsR family transcriptional regulator [Chloroflexi bacterium HGW-Chloroflexi-5]